jgi:argininosuccinate synthase
MVFRYLCYGPLHITRLVHHSKTAPLFDHLTLDRGAMHLKDELMPKYAELVYYGFWFSPEREMLQAAIDRS